MGKHRRKLPHKLREQKFFRLTQYLVPPQIRYVASGSEPNWVVLQPCDRDGVVQDDAPELQFCLSWLDPDFAVSPEDDESTRIANGDDRYEPDILEHRLEVWNTLTLTLTCPNLDTLLLVLKRAHNSETF